MTVRSNNIWNTGEEQQKTYQKAFLQTYTARGCKKSQTQNTGSQKIKCKANNQTDQKEPLTFVSLSDDPLDSIREGVGIFQSLTLKHQGQDKIIKPIWPIDTWPDSN